MTRRADMRSAKTNWWDDETARGMAVSPVPAFIVDASGRVAFANVGGLRALRAPTLSKLGRRYAPPRYSGLIAKARSLGASASVEQDGATARRLAGRQARVSVTLDTRGATLSLTDIADALLPNCAWALRENKRIQAAPGLPEDARTTLADALDDAVGGQTTLAGQTVLSLDWNDDRLIWVPVSPDAFAAALARKRDAATAFAALPEGDGSQENASQDNADQDTSSVGDNGQQAKAGAALPVETAWRLDAEGRFTQGPDALKGLTLDEASQRGFDTSGAFEAAIESRQAFETVVDGWPSADAGLETGGTARALVTGRPVLRPDGAYRGAKGRAARASFEAWEALGRDLRAAHRSTPDMMRPAQTRPPEPSNLAPLGAPEDAPDEAMFDTLQAVIERAGYTASDTPPEVRSNVIADASSDAPSPFPLDTALGAGGFGVETLDEEGDGGAGFNETDEPMRLIGGIDHEADEATDANSAGASDGDIKDLGDTAAADSALSFDEKDAFDEIARLLRDGPVGLADRSRVAENAAPAGTHHRIVRARSNEPATSPDTDALHTLLDAVPMAVVVYRDDRIMAVNKAATRLLGYDGPGKLEAEGGVGVLFAEEPRHEDAPRRLAPTRRLRRADGTTLDLLVTLRSLRWSDGTAFLLTMREPDASALAASADDDAPGDGRRAALTGGAGAVLSDDILQGLPVGVAALSADGTVMTANDQALTLLGRPDREVWNTSFLDLLCDDSRREALGDLHAAMRGDTPPPRRVIGLGPLDEDGETPCLDLSLQRYRTGGGDRLVATLTDAAPRAALERETHKTEAEREEMRRERANFVRRVSHEIRTPLNAIVGFSEVMLEERFGPLGNARYRDYAHDIREGGRRIITLVGDLMDLMRLQQDRIRNNRETIELNALVSSAVARLHGEAGDRRIIMRCSLARDLAPIMGDRESLTQVVSNLLEHALRHARSGDQVIVSTSATPEGGVAVRVRGSSEIDAAALRAVFSPFSPEVDTATGDGVPDFALPLARALAEANGADLLIESSEGRGTLTQVLFPAERVSAA